MKFILLFTLIICVFSQNPDVKRPHPHRSKDFDRMNIPNPALKFCQKAGLSTKQLKTKVGQIAVCETPDGKTIDAWKLFRQMRLKQGEMTLTYISVDEAGNVVKGEKVTKEELEKLFVNKSAEDIMKELDKERDERRKNRDLEREERIKEREERRRMRENEDVKDREQRRKEWEERRQKIEKERMERRKKIDEKMGDKKAKETKV